MVGRRSALAFVAIVAVVAGACSSAGATPSPTPAATPASTPAASVAASPSAAAESPSASAAASQASTSYPLAVATVTAGKTLTGEDGKTLYTFTSDTKDSGKSTCNGDCATNWPPYTLEADETLQQDAAASGKVTMITRDDGTKQVAYNGMPLYYFGGDKAAGDSNGQGLFNKWFIAAP